MLGPGAIWYLRWLRFPHWLKCPMLPRQFLVIAGITGAQPSLGRLLRPGCPYVDPFLDGGNFGIRQFTSHGHLEILVANRPSQQTEIVVARYNGRPPIAALQDALA